MQTYSDTSRESDTFSLPDIEVFYADKGELELEEEGTESEAGWYWWQCFPGCLPDGLPIGPFATEQDAIDDMRDNCDDW